MVKIVGVRFRSAGKVYYFDPQEYTMTPGDHVIVETSRGVEYGTVTGGIQELSEEKVTQPLKPVLRMATPEDIEKVEQYRVREKEALKVCREKIRSHGLDMKLIDAEYTFDGTKLLFYFTADGRVDFRDLVKDLASVFRTRIELRQIGVRDETKILGGVGVCGRELCCHTYLSDFAPVSIRMAKEQNLSLNPVKISGVCGRLMCCLKNEEETYEYLNSQLPANGDTVTTPTGTEGVVVGVNVLRQKVKVLFESGDTKSIEEYDAEDLTFRPRKRRGDKGKQEKKRDGEKGGSGEDTPKENRRDKKKNHDKSEKGKGENKGKGEGKGKSEGKGEGKEQRHKETRGERRRRKAAEAAAKAQAEQEAAAAAEVDEEIKDLGGFEKLHEMGDLETPEEIGELEELEILETEETGSRLDSDEE